jgi:hypothetical protein
MSTKKKSTNKPAAPRSPGRPPGRGPGPSTGRYNLSLPLDVLEWLKAHPDGPAAVAARALRREMEREQK